jgi:hypothetical protein
MPPSDDQDVAANRPSESVASSDFTITISKYLERATILTISIGALYYLGWLQVDSYLRRIGINHLSLNLPTTHYLRQGYLAVSITLLFVNLFSSQEQPAPKNKRDALLINLILLPLLIFVLFPNSSLSRQQYYFNLFVLGIVILPLVVATFRRQSVFHIPPSLNLIHRILLLLFVFALLSVRAMNEGDLRGKKAIEGNSSEVSGITFVWNNEIPADIEGKQLILILHHEDKYYVVERASPAPVHPRVYIVPDDIVKYATTASLW